MNFFSKLTSIGAIQKLALSFKEMEEDVDNRIRVVPPLLRKELFSLQPTRGNYIHGYMVNSGFSENVTEWHKKHPEVPLCFFWDRKGETAVRHIDDTLCFHPLDDKEFLRQMNGCLAYASTAGFESVCEAMYLEKPILMVPAHIEQDCNAFDAVNNGAGIISDDFDLGKLLEFSRNYRPNPEFRQWANRAPFILLHAVEPDIHTNYLPQAVSSVYSNPKC